MLWQIKETSITIRVTWKRVSNEMIEIEIFVIKAYKLVMPHDLDRFDLHDFHGFEMDMKPGHRFFLCKNIQTILRYRNNLCFHHMYAWQLCIR